MTELQTLIAAAREDFGKLRLNKAVDGLIKALEIITARDEAAAPATDAKPVLTEPAPAPVAGITEHTQPSTETTPADLARVLAAQERSETEEPVKQKATRKRAPAGTKSSDV